MIAGDAFIYLVVFGFFFVVAILTAFIKWYNKREAREASKPKEIV